ncbi:MAG TPA: hypothetical protein VNM45_17685 [Bacillus sp. (in: firmicutes)]|nr:hypothetical protein [Bacillus sp. (in: firmicutes)]
MKLIKKITSICMEFQGSDFYIKRIPEKVLANVQQRYHVPKDERIIAFLDTSLLKKGASGIIFSQSGLYWKQSLLKGKMSWMELKSIGSIQASNNYTVILGNGQELSTAGSHYTANRLALLLEKLQDEIIGDEEIEETDEMEQSAPITVNRSELSRICELFEEPPTLSETGNQLYVNKRLPRKQIKKFIEKRPLLDGDQPIAFLDVTLLRNGKAGILIAESGIYLQGDWAARMMDSYLPWHRFQHSKIRLIGEYYIEIGENNRFSTGPTFTREELLQFLTQLQRYVRKTAGEYLV